MKRKHRKNDTENEDEEEAADQNTVKESSDLTEAAATTAGNGENDSENEDGNDSDVEQGLDIINEDITETSQTKMNKMSIAALGMQKVIIAKQEHLNEISVSNDSKK